MLSFQRQGPRLCDGVTRRQWLRVGGLGVLGLSLTDLLAPRPLAASPPNPSRPAPTRNFRPQARRAGGDPRPDPTNVPGIQFCELLPRTAQRADKLGIIRSLATDDNNHDVSGYWVLIGYSYGPGSARQIKSSDWPYLGSVIKMKMQRDPTMDCVIHRHCTPAKWL